MTAERVRHVWFVGGFVAVMGALSWLVVGQSSPFHTYFIHHVGLPNVWRLVHLPPLILSILASGNVHQGATVVFIIGFILQWSVVGFLLSLLVQRRFHARRAIQTCSPPAWNGPRRQSP